MNWNADQIEGANRAAKKLEDMANEHMKRHNGNITEREMAYRDAARGIRNWVKKELTERINGPSDKVPTGVKSWP